MSHESWYLYAARPAPPPRWLRLLRAALWAALCPPMTSGCLPLDGWRDE